MRIVHIGLFSHFTPGMSYQDNLLSEQNALDGHEVIYVSDCYRYEQGKLIKTREEDKVFPNRVRLVRFMHRTVLHEQISRRIMWVKPLHKFLEDNSPDVIFYHSCSGWELLTVARYKRKHPKTRLYLDSHADRHNSASNWISLHLQHRLFYGVILRRVLPYVNKVFYLSVECGEFLRDVYGMPEFMMEYYPLGGYIINPIERLKIGNEMRCENNVLNSDTVFVHTGKLSHSKKTAELIRSFSRVRDERLHLWILGRIMPDIDKEVESLIANDARIHYFGWVEFPAMIRYLCAADLYCQPGSQSATMQNAICCGCPVMLFPYKSHEPYLKDNGFFVKSEEDMVNVFEEISRNPEILLGMSGASYRVAYELLDYKKLAARLYEV